MAVLETFAIGTDGFVVGPLAVLLLGLPAGLLLRVIAERRARQRSDRQVSNLRRYVAPALADQVAAQARPDFAGRHQHAAVLFVDIAAFTGLSQQIGPASTSELLRTFHRTVETAVHGEGGVVTGLMGDGAMAVFGLPEVRADDPVRALAAARALIRSVADWRSLQVGIGIHCGPVVIEQIGGQAPVQITATGDTVNLASRLEGLTRQHQAVIAISAILAEEVRAAGRGDLLEGFEFRPGEAIRGRRQPIDLWLLPRR
jgi:adenylate cyclase